MSDFEDFLDSREDRKKQLEEDNKTSQENYLDGIRDLYDNIRGWFEEIEQKGKVEIMEKVEHQQHPEITTLTLNFGSDKIVLRPNSVNLPANAIGSINLVPQNTMNKLRLSYTYNPEMGWYDSSVKFPKEEDIINRVKFENDMKKLLDF